MLERRNIGRYLGETSKKLLSKSRRGGALSICWMGMKVVS